VLIIGRKVRHRVYDRRQNIEKNSDNVRCSSNLAFWKSIIVIEIIKYPIKNWLTSKETYLG